MMGEQNPETDTNNERNYMIKCPNCGLEHDMNYLHACPDKVEPNPLALSFELHNKIKSCCEKGHHIEVSYESMNDECVLWCVECDDFLNGARS
jgi:hypothetical protein